MPLSVVQTEWTEHERKCLCGVLNLFSDTLYNNWLMICSGKRESRRFLTSHQYDPWISGQFSKLPLDDLRLTSECNGKVKTTLGSLNAIGNEFIAFHPGSFKYTASKFFRPMLEDDVSYPVDTRLRFKYKFDEAYEVSVIGFRIWDAKSWTPKSPIRYQYFDADSARVNPLNPRLNRRRMYYRFVVSNTLFPIQNDDVFEFIVKYNAPVQNDVPTFNFLTMRIPRVRRSAARICIADGYPHSDDPD